MFIPPMLLEKKDAPFNNPLYIFEPKIDGHRMIISYKNKETRLWTKQNNEVTSLYPELHQIPVTGDVILDGEVCCLDSKGNVDFELIQERFAIKKKDRIHSAMIHRPVHFVAFDILFYNGRDLRGLPLLKRKSILSSVLQENEHYALITSIEDRGEELFKIICDRSMEGIVAKRKESRYVSRRSFDWVKIINYSFTDVFITGYRKGEFGLLAQVEDMGRLRPAGVIEYVPPVYREVFHNLKGQLVTGEDKNFVYMKPSLKANVKFRNWYRSGMLRSPLLVDLKVDMS